MTPAHVALAYWMGRTLGDNSMTVGQWKAVVQAATGRDVLLRHMNGDEARAVLLQSRVVKATGFTPSDIERIH